MPPAAARIAPLPPPADPRRGVRGAPQVGPRGLHQRQAAWLEEHGTELGSSTSSSATTWNRPSCTASSSFARRSRLAAAARRRLTAAGSRALGARTTAPPCACSSALPRWFPRPRSTSSSSPSLETLCPGPAGPRGAPAGRRPRRARGCGRRSSRRALREDRGGLFALDLEPDGAAERLAVLVEQALPVFGAADDDLALYIAYSALGEVAGMRGRDGRRARGIRAGLRPRSAGGLPTVLEHGDSRLWSLLRDDPRVGAARVARRGRATSRSGSVPPRLPGRCAGDARSLRRGARDPRRSAGGAGRARRGHPAREPHRLRVRLGRALGWRSCRRGRVRSRGLPAARGARGRAASCRARPGTWRRRSTRSTASTRPKRGLAARRSSARATTPGGDALAAGQGEGARAPWRARRGRAARS